MTRATRAATAPQWWLMAALRPFWREVLASALLGVLTVASSVGLMMTSAWLISKCALQPSIADLGVSIVAVRFFGIARAAFRYLERLASHSATFRILAKLRVAFYKAVEPLAPARLSKFQTGDLLGRVVADVDSLQEVYLRAVAPPLVALITGVGVVALFAAFDWITALTLAAFLIAAGVALPVLVQRASRPAGEGAVAARAALNAALLDSVQGLAELVAYGAADNHLRRLEALSRTAAAQQLSANRVESASAGAMALLVNGAALAVLIAALRHVEGIYLAGLTLAVFAAFEALMPLSQAAQQWGASLSAAQRLMHIADQAPAVTDPVRPAAAPNRFDLVIRGLSFAYTVDGPPVFDSLDLTVKQGERVAILGASGSGKSTLVNLLARFWDYPTGSIRIGGVELKTLTQQDVHNLIAVLSQQGYLFNTSILENIRLARPDAADAEVVAAARRARLDTLSAARAEGFDTIVGENGAALSGGERRRIALARILLKDAPIVILDEPTAYLDTVTERALLETIFDSLEGRTLVLLTHRKTMLQRVHRVYHMRAGRLHAVRGAGE
jgi:thiol reductant ABC exporter CydC subunit